MLPTPNRQASESHGRSNPTSVLIAEDTRAIVSLLIRFLTPVADRIEVAKDGAEAVQKAMDAERANRPFDLILMDLQMPFMSGVEAMQLLRQNGVESPIVAMTAGGASAAECCDVGFDGFVAKPIDRGRFLSCVRDSLADEQ